MPWGAAIGAIGGIASSAIDASNQPEGSTPLTGFQQLPPHLQALQQEQYNLAMQQYQQGFMPGQQQIAGFNPAQQQAMNSIMGYSSPTQAGANTALQASMAGSTNPYFGMENQYLQDQVNAVQGDMQENFNQTTVPMLDSMNTRANTGFGTSSAVDDMRTDAYSDFNQQMGQVANDMYYKDYYNQTQMGENAANRQIQAAGLAPAMQGMDYMNMNAQMGVGNQQQANTQAQYNSDYDEFLRQLQYPSQQMALMSVPFGSVGGTIMQPGAPSSGTNYLNSAMGGAMAGQSLYNSFGSQPSTTPPPGFYNSVYGFDTQDMN